MDSRGHPEVFDYVGYKRIGKSRRVRRGFSVVSFFRNIENQFSWTFVDVYSPNIDVNRRLSGEARFSLAMVEFSNFIF